MIGQILGNRYEIIEKIGSGGMALVYKARCRLLNRFVAVKVLRHELTEDQEFITRFNIESQAAASLSHPNIVSIYDVGQQDDTYYIVMEYVEGITLKQYINDNGPLPWRDAINFSIQICSALEHAHKKHIVHRDIKPHNILITKEGILKVTDFGIARAVTSSTLTLGGNTIGSVHYFSPEQARGGYTDEKSDIYSLGIVMYEMLTAKVPFDGDSPVSVAIKHIQEEPLAPRRINPNIPLAIEFIILKAIKKEQSLRYGSATSMLRDLYNAYDHPDENISHETIDSAPTQKIPIVNVDHSERNQPMSQRPSRSQPDPEPEENDVQESKKKPATKEDKIAIWAAVITSLLIIGVISFFAWRYFVPDSNKPGTTAENQVVPDLVGKDFASMQSQYANTKFKIVKADQSYSGDFTAGEIISQDPKAQETVTLPHDIKVTVSLGEKTVKLPDLSNQDYRTAEVDLKNLDMNLKADVRYEPSERVAKDVVIRHVPEPNVNVKPGQTVTLFVSSGPEITKVQVQNFVGQTEEQARSAIEKSGLTVGDVTRETSDQPKGIVIRQSPESESEVAKSSAINLVVSKGRPAQPQDVKIQLPQNKDQCRVKVMANDQKVHEKIYNKTDSPVIVSITGTGTVKVDIYIDDVLQRTETLNFGGDNQ